MKTTISWIIVVVLVLAALGALIYWGTRQDEPNPARDAFAQCVTDKGFVMYGAYWCSHCQNEKKAYGDSFKYIKYVECTEEQALCEEKGIAGFPTWISGTGEKYSGEKGLKGMAEISGCEFPESK